MSSKSSSSAKAGKKKAQKSTAKPAPRLRRTTGFRVVEESYPSGRGCYFGQDLDEDYMQACSTRRVIGEYDTMDEAIKVAKKTRDSTCQFEGWSDEFYTDEDLPPYFSADGENPDEDEDVSIRIEDISKEVAADKAAAEAKKVALEKAKNSAPPKKKKNKAKTATPPSNKKAKTTAASSAPSRYPIGTAVTKKFDGKAYRGEIISYDSKAKYYKVRYEDGDEEEMDRSETERYVVGLANEKSASTKAAAAAGKSSTGPSTERKWGPAKGNFKPDENIFLRNKCRVLGGEQHLPTEYGRGGSGKTSYSYLVQRISDRNYAMRGLCLDGDGARYTSFTQRNITSKCLAFIPETNLNDHANDPTILDACHLDMVHPKTGDCFLTATNLLKAVTPEIQCMFLNGYEKKGGGKKNDDLDPNAIVKAIEICKDSLQCFALTECILTDEILKALASCKKLRGVIIYLTQRYSGKGATPATDKSLASILKSCPDLRWLYVDERSGIFDNATWKALADGACPNIEVLWVDSFKSTDERRFVARGNHGDIRKALNQRATTLKLCMINPDDKLKSRYVIGGAKKTDRLNGEKIPPMPSFEHFMYGW